MVTQEITSTPREQQLKEELDSFLYIMSHDLGAPIRHVREFSKLLVDSIDQPDEDQIAYRDFIESAVQKLDRMVAATLILSRVSITDSSPEIIQSEQLVRDITERLGQSTVFWD